MLLLKQKRAWAVLLFPALLLLARLAGQFPHLVENLFSRGFYPVMAGILGRLTSFLPFSLAEALLVGGVLAIPVAAVWLVRAVMKEPRRRREIVSGAAATVLCVIGVVYALFMFLCGFGYHRLTFAEQSGLDMRPSSTDELKALSRQLILEANTLRLQVAESEETGTMRLSFGTVYGASAFAGEAYANLGGIYPALSGFTPRAKPVALSRVMSHLDIGGIFIPFTFEANVNVDVPDYNLPSTMMHELSHFHGFMREDEANFLAYLACKYSGNADFMYSGTMLAMIHTTNALYAADRNAYWEITAEMLPGVRADLNENNAYWRQFESPVSEVATKVNDVYLRTNSQASGVNSYGEMVDLLLADFRQQPGYDEFRPDDDADLYSRPVYLGRDKSAQE